MLCYPTSNSCNLLINERSFITWNDVHIYQGTSDHFAIFGQIAISKPASAKRVVTSRNLRAIDGDQLKADLSTLSSLSMNNLTVDSLIDTYNDTLRQTLDQHAPLATRSVKGRGTGTTYGSKDKPYHLHISMVGFAWFLLLLTTIVVKYTNIASKQCRNKICFGVSAINITLL